jgi:hypothetical protein
MAMGSIPVREPTRQLCGAGHEAARIVSVPRAALNCVQRRGREWRDGAVGGAADGPGKTEAPPVGGASDDRNEEGFLKPSRIFEALTLPSVFPALGHGVSKDYRTHSKDLLAQKVCLFAPRFVSL